MWTSMNVLHSSLIGGSVLPARDENPWAAEVPDCEGQSIVPFGELWSASGLGYGMSAGGAAARLLYTISFHQICLFFLISFAFVAWAWVIVDRGGLVILNLAVDFSAFALSGSKESDRTLRLRLRSFAKSRCKARASIFSQGCQTFNTERRMLIAEDIATAFTIHLITAPRQKKERGWFRADGCFQKSNDRLLSLLFPWSNTNLLAAHSEFL